MKHEPFQSRHNAMLKEISYLQQVILNTLDLHTPVIMQNHAPELKFVYATSYLK